MESASETASVKAAEANRVCEIARVNNVQAGGAVRQISVTAGDRNSRDGTPGAKAADGTVLAPMPPATVYVRPPASAVLAPTHTLGDRLGLDSGFRLTFSRPVDLASLIDYCRSSNPEPHALHRPRSAIRAAS